MQLHFDRAMEAMHALGHIYHLLSDFVMLAAEPPPRLLRTAVAVQVQATTVVQQAVPVHVSTFCSPHVHDGTIL